MAQVAREQGQTLPRFTMILRSWTPGSDSLGIAIVVARLQDRLGIDPFTGSEDVDFPVTLRFR